MIKKGGSKLILITATFFVGCFFIGVPQVFAMQPPSVTSISPSSGPISGGTGVTIGGTGFAIGIVTIGGTLATDIKIISSTQITATTPAGAAGTWDVVFTRTSDGKSGTLTGGFTYVAPHTITASAGANGSISPSGAVSVNDGASQSFTITPDANYQVSDVLVDSVSVGAVISYDFINVIDDHTIAAAFIIIPPTPDTTAPSAVSDLAASNATQTSIDLEWTAPGDDANSGTASSYDVRYSVSEITAGNWDSATEAIGEPSPSVAGTIETMTVSGLTAETIYYFALKSSDEVPNESGLSNVSSLATSEEEKPTPSPPTISAGGGSLPTSVVFSGQAYPGCKIEILRKSMIETVYKSVPVKNSSILPDGTFSFSYQALLQGDYFFALHAEDKDGNKTGIISFNVDLLSDNSMAAKNIFVPPTLKFDSGVIAKDKDIVVSGYSAPNSKIEIRIGDKITEETESNNSGYYTFIATTAGLGIGEHYIKARQIKDGKTSSFSFPKAFKISSLIYPRADFNSDNQINITDWSVFLYRWGCTDKTLKSKIDMDDNGNINIVDFSIFLKTMTI